MGVLIVADEPLMEGVWTHVQFYRSTDGGVSYDLLGEKTIDFSDANSLMWYDTTGSLSYQYKVKYRNDDTGEVSDYTSCEVIEEVYTTVNNVARLIGIPVVDLVKKYPSVVRLIKQVEDYIDNRLRTTWKSKQVTEYYTPIQTFSIDGFVIFTKFRPIISVDKLEIWNGSEWEDWIQTRNEGRDEDYWIDYNLGEIFIMSTMMPLVFMPDKLQVRITYTYGRGANTTNRETVIPKDLEMIATKLVAIDILTNEDYRALLPTGENYVSLDRRIEKFKEDVEEWFSRNIRWIPAGEFR